MEILSIIPARGGSKSIPRKNIRMLAGYPLIAYSIASSLASKKITRTIVSTDDSEIAEISRRYGAEVPFTRPAELADDTVTDLPVFEHALTCLEKAENYTPDLVVQLRPTSPFRPSGVIDEAIRSLQSEASADCVRSVSPSPETPYKMWKISSGRLLPVIESDMDEAYNMPRQELPPTFIHNGQIDVIRASTILNKHSLTGDVILPYIQSGLYTVDLDTPEDWEYAEYLVNRAMIELPGVNQGER